MAGQTVNKGGRAAWVVIGGALLLGTLLSVFVVYPNLKKSAASIGAKMRELDTLGATMTADQCVEHVIDWFQHCDVMPAMCLQEVPKAVAHCLRAKDRTSECEPLLALPPTSQWTYHRCADQGIDKRSKKELTKSCTAAWRALDQYCKSGQRGVVWGVK